MFVPNRGEQAIEVGVIADQAFVHSAVAEQDPGLRLSAHRPLNRYGEGAGAVAYGVGALPVMRLYRVEIRAAVEGEFGVRTEFGVVARKLHGATHLGGRLGERLRSMAAAAGDRLLISLSGYEAAPQEENHTDANSLHWMWPLAL